MNTGPKYLIMGIVNVTPDSFSDGGNFLDPSLAVDQCVRLIDHGADYIDIGAESSRPGAVAITPDAEWQRLEPVLGLLAQRNIAAKISIDTRNPQTMLKAAQAGISMINNICGLADSDTLKQLAATDKMEYLAMHMSGSPGDMQNKPLAAAAARVAVENFFHSADRELRDAGFAEDEIWLDPGIGFGKTDAANVNLIANTRQWSRRFNIGIGVSRKSWLGRTLEIPVPKDRDSASKMLELGLWIAGAKLIRTHDVKRLNGIRVLLERAG
jgi:dihydropteroate synthase